ncbi:MAG: hypothetical protein IH933_16895 [Euryarchaeota archaeon]|nr:hypothetical protein [Euryarchaeota archaeon]
MARPSATRSLGIVGSLALFVGAYLPWVIANPSYETVNLIRYLGMGWGITDVLKLAVLCCGLVALALIALSYWKSLGRISSGFLAATGAISLLLSIGVFLEYTISGMFIAWFGCLVSGIGGCFVLFVGVSEFRAALPFR